MQCNSIQHNTIMCCLHWNISWTFHELLLLWQEITLPFGHSGREDGEQDERKSGHGCIMMNTGSNNTRLSYNTTPVHASHHSNRTFNLDTAQSWALCDGWAALKQKPAPQHNRASAATLAMKDPCTTSPTRMKIPKTNCGFNSSNLVNPAAVFKISSPAAGIHCNVVSQNYGTGLLQK